MSELRELYQQVILDHYKKPRNFRKLEGANRTAAGDNPLCGDHVDIYVRVEDDVIREIGFQGLGCAISRASASVMSAAVKGKTTAEVERLFEAFHKVVTSGLDAEVDRDGLGKLAVFAGVREFPVRVKCATLPWHALRAALEGKAEMVTTE